ncbi:unnamed protein product [Owenia fusiformis]|uniref:C2H2-type domain-containing protein n=1 Tax=Owenia fusiformis TaxID=6347 RepID=A0A8S4PLI6_OWEFU|nr:unnamed protein product [Owenia fusiformis]
MDGARGVLMYNCETCDLQIENRAQFFVHMQQNHGKLPYKCRHCNETFANTKYFIFHILKIHQGFRWTEITNPENSVCDICGRVMKRENIKDHKLRKHSNFRPVTCTLCGKRFLTNGELNAHMVYHNEKRFMCQLCGVKFFKRFELKSHTNRIHLKTKMFSCKHCKVEFMSVDKRWRHYLESPECVKVGNIAMTVYTCETCKKQFQHKAKLEIHIERYHKVGKETFTCTICSKAYSVEDSLKYHIRTVHGKKSNKCHLCYKSFQSKSILNNHIRTHTGEKPHKCEVCNVSFSHNGTLYRHQNGKAHIAKVNSLRPSNDISHFSYH